MKLLILLLFSLSVNGMKLSGTYSTSINWNIIGPVYTLTVTGIDLSDNSDQVSAINGVHLSGKSNADVKMIYFGGINNCPRFNLKKIPQKLTNFFTNLIALQLQGCSIETLSGNELFDYTKLQWYLQSNTNLTRIPGEFFSRTPELRFVQFSNNKIRYIGEGLFDTLRNLVSVSLTGNSCANISATDATQISTLISSIKVNCPDLVTTTTSTLPPTPNPNLDFWPSNDPRWDQIPSLANPNAKGPSEEFTKAFWNNKGQSFLNKKINTNVNLNRAKNVVIMIGDGMGISTQMAARSYIRDPNVELSFEKFPYSGHSKTYCVNYQVPDSASTATAILSGIKTNFFSISLTAEVEVGNCTAAQNEATHIDSIFKYAQDAGKATGVVTTTRITHATPAAAYAKTPNRIYEFDQMITPGCEDIAYQLIHGSVGDKLDAKLGGGSAFFLPTSQNGARADNRNLINDFILKSQQRGEIAVVAFNRSQLNSVNAATTNKLLGLFGPSHLQYKLLADDTVQPTLTEMVAKTLEILKKNENGFVLLVEGGMIDTAHHENRAQISLGEVVEFHKAVEYVKANTNEEETLIVVTADHSHPFTVGGFIPRFRNILGPADYSYDDQMWTFSTAYGFGRGYQDHNEPTGGRKNPRGMNYMDLEFKHPSMVPMEVDTHSGEDVGVYASGPYSHLFTGVFEQNYIAHAMFYASCLGPNDFLKNPKCT